MSLLWPNRLEVLLSAQGAAASQSKAGLFAGANSREQKQQFVPTPTPAPENAEQAHWHAACTSLETLLKTIQVKPNTQLTIVLSSDFIRYQLLPAQQVSMSTAEKTAYAAAAYKDIYGAEIDGWQIKLHETDFNQAIIAAAIDAQFLAKIQQISQQYLVKLVSVQAYLMAAYNSASKQLKQLSGYFVVVEANTLMLLNMQQGKCQHLRMSAIDNHWQQDLQQLLARESMLNDGGGQEVLLHAPAQQKTINIEGWKINLAPQARQLLQFSQFKPNSQSAILKVAA